MTNNDILELKEYFKKNIEKDEERLKTLRLELQNAPKKASEEVEQTQLNADINEIKNRANDIKLNLEKMKIAYIKIDKNLDYGFCEGCGDEIEKDRLKALPTSISCFTCCSIKEKKLKQYA